MPQIRNPFRVGVDGSAALCAEKYRRLCRYIERNPEVGIAAGLVVAERKGSGMETPQMSASLHDQIRAAQSEIGSPLAEYRFRDALLLALAPRYDDDLLLRTAVERVMGYRRERVAESLAALEAWGAKRAKDEGMALLTATDVLAAALLQRFGGAAEIPVDELDGVAGLAPSIQGEEDTQRRVVTFRLAHEEPKP